MISFCSPCSKFNLLDLGTTLVCKICGKEIKQGPNPAIGARVGCDSALFITHYSRVNRFLKLFESVVLPHATAKDTKMLTYLDTRKNDITSPETLLHCMQDSKLPDKRYVSVHLFTKIYVPSYKLTTMPTRYLNDKWCLERQFRDIEFTHRKSDNDQFYNYAWLLRHLLTGKSQYQSFLPYIKKIKCKKRRKRYFDMFQELARKPSLNIDCIDSLVPACGPNCDALTLEHEGGP
jgi:hypothetical protein